VHGLLSNPNLARIFVGTVFALLVFVAVFLRHGLTLALGTSMVYISGRTLLLWILGVLALVIALVTVSGVWRR
jgi:hypothetical protein